MINRGVCRSSSSTCRVSVLGDLSLALVVELRLFPNAFSAGFISCLASAYTPAPSRNALPSAYLQDLLVPDYCPAGRLAISRILVYWVV